MRGSPPRLIGILTSLVLTMGLTMPAAANDVTELAPVNAPPVASDESVNELANTWFVELASQPAVKGTPKAQLKREKDQFRANAQAQGLQYTERFAFDTLFNGLSITLDTDSLASVQRIPGVKAIWPVVTLAYDPGTQISPELATAINMTGADVAQNELGLTGAGVKVAVMDTGIDHDHPDLGGPCFGTGCRVATGWDFVGDDFNADPSSSDYNPVPAPDADPDDCNGHGTHVAGIVGASGDVTGVAPGVTFGAYRVFGCEGSTTADIMMAAMERALADAMDVLNMSIGSAFQWPQYPTAVAADSLVDRGMVVVASIGNSGANGTYSTGAPGNGQQVIGVASFDNSHVNALTFNINPGGEQVAYLEITETTDAPTSGTSAEVVYIGRGCPQSGPSWNLPEADPYLDDPNGKVALIDRGICTFESKYQRAIDAGAVGVVTANNGTGLFAGGGVSDRGFFNIAISQADGNVLKDRIEAGATRLDWTENRVNAPNPTGGLMSSFSSYGLAPDLSFKPNLGAPGGLIRSTWPMERGGYAIISGTSMSSPHVAGAAALYLDAHPSATAADIKVAFQNSADPALLALAPFPGIVEPAFRQGAGMLDVDDAILSTQRVLPSEIAMGESEAGPQSHTLALSNGGAEPVTYEFGHEPAITVSGTFGPDLGFWFSDADVSFGSESVTVAPGSPASVEVTITPATGPDQALYGGYLVLAGDDGTVMRVPYAGFIGDYQSIVAMPIGETFPTLARLTECDRYIDGSCTMGGDWDLVEDGEVYTLEDEFEEPQFLLHFDHQVQELRFEVFDADTGRNFGRIATIDYFGRSSTASTFFAFGFDGEIQKGRNGRMLEVPDGTYEVKVSVLKALGDEDNLAHWETWTSQEFVVDRP